MMKRVIKQIRLLEIQRTDKMIKNIVNKVNVQYSNRDKKTYRSFEKYENLLNEFKGRLDLMKEVEIEKKKSNVFVEMKAKNNKSNLLKHLRAHPNFEIHYTVDVEYKLIYRGDDKNRGYRKINTIRFEGMQGETPDAAFQKHMDANGLWAYRIYLGFLVYVGNSGIAEVNRVNEYRDLRDTPLRLGDPYKCSALQHNDGIDEVCYKNTNNQCVITALIKRWDKYVNTKKNKTPEIIEDFRLIGNKLYPNNPRLFIEGYGKDVRITPTARMIYEYCKLKNITCVGFDFKDKVLLSYSQNRSLSRNNDLNAIYFYIFMGHFYLLTKKDTIKSLGGILSSMCNDFNINKNNKDDDDDKKIISKEYIEIYEHDIIENLDELLKNENKNYIVKCEDFNDILHKYIQSKNDIPKIKFSKLSVVDSFKGINKNTFYRNTEDIIDRNYIKHICEKTEIPFKLQSIGELILNLQSKFYIKKRHNMSKDERVEIIESLGGCCKQCDETTDLQIDHIKPIAQGGDDDFENMQLLCVSCHREKSREETENRDYTLKLNHMSYFNLQTSNVINSSFFDKPPFNYAYNRQMRKVLKRARDMDYEEEYEMNDYPIKEIDRSKSRRNILINMKYEYCVYSVLDNIEIFDGDIKTGNYYIEMDEQKHMPLSGNRWYNYVLVQYCLDCKIIKRENIKYQFIPSRTIKCDYFQDFVKYLDETLTYNEEYLNECNKKTIEKLPVNTLIGLFGRRDSEYIINLSCGSKEEADAYKSIVKNSVEFNFEDLNFKSINATGVIKSLKSFYPIYSQILDIEAMELHKMTTLLENNNYEIIAVKTDAVLYRKNNKNQPDVFDVSNYLYENGLPMMKNEDKEPRIPPNFLNDEIIKYNKYNTDKYVFEETKYNMINDFNTTDNWKSLSNEIIDSEKGILIQGAAGTGKSSLTNTIKNNLLTKKDEMGNIKYSENEIQILTPTNKSALIIDGKTLDKFVNTNGVKQAINKKANTTKYIIVDEVSMMKERFYEELINYKFMNPNIKFIIIGDYYQLCPVNDTIQEGQNYKRLLKKYKLDTAIYAKSRVLYELCDGNMIELKECKRADTTVFDLCDDIKHNKKININHLKNNVFNYKNVAFTNVKCQEINLKCVEKYINTKKLDFIKIEKLDYDIRSQSYRLSIGMPLIARKNIKKLKLTNNATYNVTDITNKEITVIDTKMESIKIPIEVFNQCFYLAFCITIHKSQGETYDEPYSIHEWDRLCKTKKYVAFSRTTKIEHISIYE